MNAAGMTKAALLVGTTEVERFRLLVEAVTDYAIYMLDTNGIVTSWNAGAERIKGYKASEILGRSFANFYEEADRKAGIPQRVLAIATRDGKFQAEGWRVRKDGSRFWAFVIIDAIYDNGELIGFAKITRDLTERREAEEELRRSEELFRRLVEGVTDYAIYMLDPDGIVSNWNAGAQRIKGYGPDEIVGQHFSIFYTDDDRSRGEPARSLAIAEREGRFEAEAWRQRKDGSRFWANVVIDAIRDPSGKLVGFAKITRDITERREVQLALERTREALAHSQKIEAIGKLTGGVAHDFNNLLTVVLGSLDLLRRYLPNDDPRVTRLLDNALQGAQRGATLTQRMLAFARRQELDLRPVDLVELTRGMRDLLQRSLGPQIAIETRFPLPLDYVMADPHQLETALLNLAINARDAMPAGGILTIAARNEATVADAPLRPGRYVRLTLRDTGEGMDAETLTRATEPFFTTKGTGKGTGLGLSMVHGMVEQLGGQLILHSKPGEGTTAELWLPAVEQAAATEPSEAGIRTIAQSRALTILAVDDDALVLANTRAMLEDLGHTVVVAYSGEQALERLERTPTVDLVITDHAMPKMTGSDLAKTIMARRPGMPIILATGYAELPPAAESSVPRLSKPFRQDALAEAVANAVRTSREASP
ncbi:hybrid sensor histidine kinase/response regulator [Reyranella soli]|uniref:histidine kinase n=1 Tax=Reyranella soli TaxID=1230389 RepID=A0A512N216_9HYPH|nr:PAS domain-containing sensor histidine kinase [Reyranella soli]GEP53027.1 histidine kinase [Reyranella soli]